MRYAMNAVEMRIPSRMGVCRDARVVGSVGWGGEASQDPDSGGTWFPLVWGWTLVSGEEDDAESEPKTSRTVDREGSTLETCSPQCRHAMEMAKVEKE